MSASNQVADSHVITIFAHRKPSNSEKLLTFPQFYYVLDQESFRISHIFLFLCFGIFVGCCYCCLFLVFCYIYLPAIHSEQDFCTVSTKATSRYRGFFLCFLLISTSFHSIEKYFYHSFLYLLSTLFM